MNSITIVHHLYLAMTLPLSYVGSIYGPLVHFFTDTLCILKNKHVNFMNHNLDLNILHMIGYHNKLYAIDLR